MAKFEIDDAVELPPEHVRVTRLRYAQELYDAGNHNKLRCAELALLQYTPIRGEGNYKSIADYIRQRIIA